MDITGQYLFLTFHLLLISLESKCSKATPTPPLTVSKTQTLLLEPSVLLDPTATYNALSASVYVRITTGCGGNLTNHTGQLTHPGYPKPLAMPTSCTWRIKLEQRMRVSLLFNYLDIKGECRANFIEIWENTTGGSQTLLRRSCGNLDKPERLISKTNTVDVVLKTNSSISGGGFLVTYSTFKGCNQTFSSNTGLIQTPYYPNDYPLNVQCTYSILAPAGHQISLSLEFLDLVYSVNCTGTVLEVWNGQAGLSSPIRRYCGYLFSDWLTSKGNVLTMTFISDMFNSRRGFQLRYYAIKSECNSTLNSTTGYISNPNTNGPCSWTINALQGKIISLRFDRFFLALSENCSRDYLVIKDSQSVIGRYCGYQKGETVYSNDNSVTLEYFSTMSEGRGGLQIYYQAIVNPGSYKYLNKTRGYLQSPLYPDNYPSNTVYSWLVELSAGYVIDLAFDDFELEFAVNCSKDYMEVFDGDKNSSLSLGKYCGTKRPNYHVTTSGNLMYVEFVADSKRRMKGFKVSYSGIKSDCPRNFTNSTGTVHSPNYPDFYPNNYHCNWHISYAEGYQIYLTISYFDLAFTEQCTGDYVIFKGLTDKSPDYEARHCGYVVKRNPLVSKKNTIIILFRTDGRESSRGFVFSYKVDGTGYPPPSRSAMSSELEQAVMIEMYNITKSKWITNRDVAFKKLVANATNIFCEGDNRPICRLVTKHRQRRSLNPEFTMESVHLAPGFPQEVNSVLVVVMYALYSSDIEVDRSWMSRAIPRVQAVEIMLKENTHFPLLNRQ